MTTVQIVYDDAKNRRVVVFQRDDGSFGFEVEHFSQEPLERAWVPVSGYSVSRCDTASRALAEAYSRVTWLVGSDGDTTMK